MHIGYSGHGTLSVNDGGQVNSATSYVGRIVGSIGTASVDGAVSKWTNSGDLHVGYQGLGALSVTNGGQVSNSGGYIGSASGSTGTASIDGANSLWTSSSDLHVGYNGAGTLSVTGGVVVLSQNTNPFPFIPSNGYIGYGSTSAGLVRIDGMRSTLGIQGGLYVGYSGAGTLNVTGAGTLVVTRCGGMNGNAYIGYNTGSVGTVSVDGGNSSWTNYGLLGVGYPGGGTGTLSVTNGGRLSNNLEISIWAGELTVTDNAMVSVNSPLTFNLMVSPMGEVHGNGTIVGNLLNDGLVFPGNSPGALHFTGVYTQTVVGKLLIELAGTTPGSQYDQLLITGSAALDGTLQVSLLSGFAPSLGNSFDLLTTTSGITGTFANQQLPLLAGGLVWNLNYGTNDVILSVGGVPGDYNHNGIVDAADYTVWRDSLGQTGTGLAANGDDTGASAGVIDQADYNIWKANFGNIAGPGAGSGSAGALPSQAAVPEPASALLSVLAGFCWYLFADAGRMAA